MYIICLNRDVCLNPQDELFNWRIKKDPRGTKKCQLPTIIVTPPSTTMKAISKRKKRPCKTSHVVDDQPKKLVLSPGFWSKEVAEKPRTRKRRLLLKCRNVGCTDQFPSVRDREMHERHCHVFEEVFTFNPQIFQL